MNLLEDEWRVLTTGRRPLSQDPEQQVLVTNVRVIESTRFLLCALEHALRLIGERNLDGGR
jgi:hypothetical protein